MPGRKSSPAKNIGDLRNSLIGFSAISIIALLLGYWLLAAYWATAFAARWAIVSAAALSYQLIILRRDLRLNVLTSNHGLLSTFGIGTWISLVRMLCVGLMAGFLGLPLPSNLLAWMPFALYLTANLCDLVDGYAARRTMQVTLLGQKLDQDLDGRGLLIACLLAFQYGAVAWWFLSVGFARYLFVFGIWILRRKGKRIFELEPNPGRRALAGTQMGVTTAMLAPILSPPATILASSLFMIPFVWNFYVDWLQVSGQKKLGARFSKWRRMLRLTRKAGFH